MVIGVDRMQSFTALHSRLGLICQTQSSVSVA